MINELQRTSELFVANRNIIKNTFKSDGDLMALAGSTIFTGFDITANEEKLKECAQIIKKNSAAFSGFRGNAKIPILCQMAMTDKPENHFQNIASTYSKMNKSTVFDSDSKLIAAVTICNSCGSDTADHYIEMTQDIYQRMKQEHRWLTSDSDIPFAAMLAVSGTNVDTLVKEMEQCFQILKKKFPANASQSLSHVLALSRGSAEYKCRKVMEIFDGLKAAKHGYGTDYELASLGALVELDIPIEQIVQEISNVDTYLKKQKGFGDMSIGSAVRRMYAGLIVLNSHHSHHKLAETAVIGSTLAITASMEACMIIILCC